MLLVYKICRLLSVFSSENRLYFINSSLYSSGHSILLSFPISLYIYQRAVICSTQRICSTFVGLFVIFTWSNRWMINRNDCQQE